MKILTEVTLHNADVHETKDHPQKQGAIGIIQ